MDQPVNFIRTQVEVMSQKYTIRIDRPLTDPSEFQEELATLRIAGPFDHVHILLNGPGGSDSVMKAFLNAMAQSEAHIITEIEGQCCSALTMIFLAGHEFRISDDSEFMIHTGSFGYSGKENNVRQFVEFNAKSNARLMHKYYRHYLTPEEIEECIEGKDFWMDADEIIERLEKRQQLFSQEQDDVEQELEAMFEESLPKDKLETLDKSTLIRLITGEMEDEEFDSIFGDYNELPVDWEVIKTTQDLSMLKSLADTLSVKYSHNIGIEKLRSRILDTLDTVED